MIASLAVLVLVVGFWAVVFVAAFIAAVVYAGRNVSRWDVRGGDGPRCIGNWRSR